MKKLITLFYLSLIVLLGCSTNIDNIDTSTKNQDCVRQCTNTYSMCISGSFGIQAQNACANGFKVCSNTCPSK